MKYIVPLLILVMIAGCTQKPKKKKKACPECPVTQAAWPVQPVVDIPLNLRQRNPDGSCVHCSFVTVLANQQAGGQPLYEAAKRHFARHRGGETDGGLRRKLDADGIQYADTINGDVNFIDWSIRTRRGCLVNDKPRHVRTLVGGDNPNAPNPKIYILDNNGKADKLYVYNRNEWIAMWNRQGGWAATPVYDPHPVVTHR